MENHNHVFMFCSYYASQPSTQHVILWYIVTLKNVNKGLKYNYNNHNNNYAQKLNCTAVDLQIV